MNDQIKTLLNLLYEYDIQVVKTGETLWMTHTMDMDIKLKPDATTLKAKPYWTSGFITGFKVKPNELY
jgi:hypothetical protein